MASNIVGTLERTKQFFSLSVFPRNYASLYMKNLEKKNIQIEVIIFESGVCHRLVEMFYSVKPDTSLINLYRSDL